MMVSMYGSLKGSVFWATGKAYPTPWPDLPFQEAPGLHQGFGFRVFSGLCKSVFKPFFLKGDGRFLWVYEGLGARARAFRVDWFRAPRDLWEVPTLGAWMQDEKCRFQACRADKWFRTTPYIRTYCLIAVPLTIRSLQKFQCRLSI